MNRPFSESFAERGLDLWAMDFKWLNESSVADFESTAQTYGLWISSGSMNRLLLVLIWKVGRRLVDHVFKGLNALSVADFINRAQTYGSRFQSTEYIVYC